MRGQKRIYIEVVMGVVLLIAGIVFCFFYLEIPMAVCFKMLIALLTLASFLHAGIPKPVVAFFLTIFLYPIFSTFYFVLTATDALGGLAGVYFNISMMPVTVSITLIISRISFHIREADRLKEQKQQIGEK